MDQNIYSALINLVTEAEGTFDLLKLMVKERGNGIADNHSIY